MSFFSKILKQKKILFFVLIFFVISGIILPQIAQASWNWLGCGIGVTAGGSLGSFLGCTDTGTSIVSTAASATGDLILWGTGRLLFTISKWILKFSANLFETAMSSTITQKPITSDATVLAGWKITRDFANMFIVLGFVVVGIAMILRLREYGAIKTLISLIIVALLINFSLLFCGIIIDATNIAMNYFLNPLSGPGVGATALTQPLVANLTSTETSDALSSQQDPTTYASMAFGLSVDALVAAMIFFIYAILFLFRYVALMCLVILSPLGIVCYVFPATHGIYKKWWEQFMQWAIIGVPTGFFIYLASGLGQTWTSKGDILSFWIPTVFLLFAYSLIFQTSAIGASAAIGLATGAVGYAAGATKWAGGKALRAGGMVADKTGVSQKIKTVYGNALESIGARRAGTTASHASKGVEDAQKRIGSMTEEEQTKKATGRAGRLSAHAQEDKVAAILNKIKDGKVGHLGDTAAQEQAIAYAESHAKSMGYVSTARKDASKYNPNIALDATKSVHATENDKFREAIEKQSPREYARNIDKTAITPQSFHITDDKQAYELSQRGAKEKRNATKKMLSSAEGLTYKASLTPAEQAEWDAKAAFFL